MPPIPDVPRGIWGAQLRLKMKHNWTRDAPQVIREGWGALMTLKRLTRNHHGCDINTQQRWIIVTDGSTLSRSVGLRTSVKSHIDGCLASGTGMTFPSRDLPLHQRRPPAVSEHAKPILDPDTATVRPLKQATQAGSLASMVHEEVETLLLCVPDLDEKIFDGETRALCFQSPLGDDPRVGGRTPMDERTPPPAPRRRVEISIVSARRSEGPTSSTVHSDSAGQREDTTRERGDGPSDSFDFRSAPAPLVRSASVSKSGDALATSDRPPPGLKHPSALESGT